MDQLRVLPWSSHARRARRHWRSTAFDDDPVRSDLVIVESLAVVSAICAVLFGSVVVWMNVGSDFQFPWWSKTFTIIVTCIATYTFLALHTSRATWFYRHTDIVTAVAAVLVIGSPALGYAGAQSAYPAYGFSMAVVAFAGILQRRSHVVVLTSVAVLAWIAGAVAFGTGVSVSTFAVTILRTVVVVAVIHFVRFKTIELLAARYRAVEQARAHADSLSRRDDLTGLLNRRGMHRSASAALAACAESSRPVSVLFLDVNGLKEINDTSGHDAGDAALVRLAAVLTVTFDPDHVVGRVGGDEFVVVLPGVDRAEAVGWGRRTSVDLSTAEVSVSVGLAVWEPGTTTLDLDELLRRADDAMYRVKPRRSSSRHW